MAKQELVASAISVAESLVLAFVLIAAIEGLSAIVHLDPPLVNLTDIEACNSETANKPVDNR